MPDAILLQKRHPGIQRRHASQNAGLLLTHMTYKSKGLAPAIVLTANSRYENSHLISFMLGTRS